VYVRNVRKVGRVDLLATIVALLQFVREVVSQDHGQVGIQVLRRYKVSSRTSRSSSLVSPPKTASHHQQQGAS
jgi:hypothetical protein